MDRLPWPVMILGAPVFWFLPQRTGSTFVKAGWTAALLAHLIWATFGVGCVITAFDNNRYGLVAHVAGRWPVQAYRGLLEQPKPSEAVRSPWIKAFTTTASTTCCPAHFAMGLGIRAGLNFELPLLILAILVMPYITTGERPLRLLARSVRLTLWSSTSLVVLGVALQALLLTTGDGKTIRSDQMPFLVLIIAVYALWLLRMVVRSGTGRTETSHGPEAGPEVLRCQDCGYCLDGIDVGSCCPECGTPIRTSVPEYRTPSARAIATGADEQMSGFFATSLKIFFQKDYYRRLAIRGGYEAARRFAVRVGLFGGLLGCPMVVILMMSPSMGKPMTSLFGTISGAWTGLVILLTAYLATACVFLLAAGGLGWALSLFGFRPMRRPATIAFYQSIWLLPIGLSELPVMLFLLWGETRGWPQSMGWLYLTASEDMRGFTALALACHVLPLFLCALAAARMRRALRQTRYAYE